MKVSSRSLAFYIRYWTEMEYFDGIDDSAEAVRLLRKNGVKNPTDVLSQMRQVSKAASAQAADFLIRCTDRAELYLGKYCKTKVIRRRSGVMDDWYTEMRLIPRGKRIGRVSAGVSMSNEHTLSVIPYIWVAGGVANEKRLYDLIRGSRITDYVGRAADEGYMSGCVLIGRTDPRRYIKKFTVDEAALLREVISPFSKMDQSIVNKILKIPS